MLKRYWMSESRLGDGVIAQSNDSYGLSNEVSPAGWVRYEDAEALQMRVIELEQQLKTQDQLRAEFEKECG